MHSLLSCANRFEGGVDAPIPLQLTVDCCAPCARVTFVSLGLLPNSRMREHRRLLGAVVIVLQLVVSQAVRSSLPLNLPVYAPCLNSARLHHELPMQKTRLPVCTVGDETCQLPCGPCNTRAFIYESAAARLAFTNVIHDRNTTVMSLEVRVALRAICVHVVALLAKPAGMCVGNDILQSSFSFDSSLFERTIINANPS